MEKFLKPYILDKSRFLCQNIIISVGKNASKWFTLYEGITLLNR